MLILQNISYTHPNGDSLFSNLNLTINRGEKIALIGNNGSGKSTLLQLIAGKLKMPTGEQTINSEPYLVPQVFGQYNQLSVAAAMGIDNQLHALREILKGNGTEELFESFNDDWTIEERATEALRHWQLEDLAFEQKMESLSGGQKTKVFLAGIAVHQPELILLDEPSNHLDGVGRGLLYDLIRTLKSTYIVVSHDKTLLNLLDITCELSDTGIATYGGNYDFYAEQKEIEQAALHQEIQDKAKTLRKFKEKERETLERQNKLDNRGRGKQEKAGVARIMMNTLRNSAEKSSAKLKSVHTEKIDGLAQTLHHLRTRLPDVDQMKFGFSTQQFHQGKVMFTAQDLNFAYGEQRLWKKDLNIQLRSGDRIRLNGNNGSGKTTLIKLILGELEPQFGKVDRSKMNAAYLDQDYSLIDNKLTVYQQAQKFNSDLLQHEINIRLNRFLFSKDDWSKPCSVLSGGERMRLMLCCLTINTAPYDLIALDEPTNNLDLQNIEILIAAINEYKGTLIVVSHDEAFVEGISVGSWQLVVGSW